MRYLEPEGSSLAQDSANRQAVQGTTPPSRITSIGQNIFSHRTFPWGLALAAIVFMIPALRSGLTLDDLIQRVIQYRVSQLPTGITDTGFVSGDSGKLGTVLCDLFGFPRGRECAARARDYGLLPWWTPEDLQAALWRPLTAFTHWLDYRLFPNTPALMHAENIAWYAVAVLLAALIYREIGSHSLRTLTEEKPASSTASLAISRSAWAAGLAAFLFLLDKNTYFPVAFVANRGFIVSLVFGLLFLDTHHRWRITKSKLQAWLSALYLLLALSANEGGASTLAFLIAYALVLEPGRWRARLGTLLPAALVVVGWRAVYAGFGFGVRHVGGYIDPGYEPLVFLRNLPLRANALLGGQLSGLTPEASLLCDASVQTAFTVFFVVFNLVCALVFFPVLRRDRAARFWGLALLLALVPAATVLPLTKNLAFVAVGAFGLVASWMVSLACKQGQGPSRRVFRLLCWCVAAWLIIAHVPGALASRVIMAKVAPLVPRILAGWCAFDQFPEFGEHHVVIINNPAQLTTMASPFYRAYHGESLPKSIRTLIPGSTRFEVKRLDANTLTLSALGADLFGCDSVGPIHECYLFKAVNEFLAGGKTWKPGEQVLRTGFMAKVVETSDKGLPRSVSFHFNMPLESKKFTWLFFDWKAGRYSGFVLPRVGETIEIRGPSAMKMPGLIRQ